jgi:asparagine synthase (glutamine-hydrolysing)
MVYNGELYNTEDLRRELSLKGYAFRGWSDTEVLLTAYMEWGEGCLEKLNGIFAFAVWEEKNQRLFLARDRIGVKPLFYTQSGQTFLFGSELKALFRFPAVSPRINGEGLAEIFVMGPARTPGNGVFSGVSQLRPGWSRTFDRGGIKRGGTGSLKAVSMRTILRRRCAQCGNWFGTRWSVSWFPTCRCASAVGRAGLSVIAAVAANGARKNGKGGIDTVSVDY